VNNLDFHIHSALIEECKKGKKKAQYSLYNHYSRAMYNLAYRILNNREDAEDALQEAFCDCFRKLETFRFESTFGAWLKRILVNKCITQVKKRKTDLVFLEDHPYDVSEEEPEITPNPEIIFNSIGQLADGYRIILTLYLLEGYTHAEISEIMGITESTSKSQYSRAKNKLRLMILNNQKNGQA
jgi:RNA polymerase sigma factor (sigma-70 family)